MSQAIKEQSPYAELFREFTSDRREPAWLARARAAAFERFARVGFPTTDEEDWKYTNVAPLARRVFRPAEQTGDGAAFVEREAAAVETFTYGETRASRLVFIDGLYSPAHSSLAALPHGVVVTDLSGALAGDHEEALRRHLTPGAERDADAFAALNTAFLRDGAFVLVPRGVKVETPIQLLFVARGQVEDAASFPRVVVIAERDSSATIIESYVAEGEAAYFTDALVDVSVEEGARLTHYKVQNEGAAAFHIAATHARLGRACAYELTTITLGARLSRHGIEVALEEEGAECRVDGLYVVGAGQHADTHSLIDHRRPHCTSRQNYKGILDGNGRAVFNGRVFVHPDAQQTDAQQSNKNLLLSPEARVDTKPQLEIFADDVKCAHGATVGQLEEEELFYLVSRGLHPELARNLLTYGFAEEIIDEIEIESIKAQLDAAILNRLHAQLEA